MSATLATIAEGVAQKITGAHLGEGLTATWSWQPAFKLSDFTDLRVTVVPHAHTRTKISRAAEQCEYQVDVAVQKKVPAGAAEQKAAVSELVELAEKIADLFGLCELDLGSGRRAVWTQTENSPVVSQDHLAELHQFTGILTLTFKVLP